MNIISENEYFRGKYNYYKKKSYIQCVSFVWEKKIRKMGGEEAAEKKLEDAASKGDVTELQQLLQEGPYLPNHSLIRRALYLIFQLWFALENFNVLRIIALVLRASGKDSRPGMYLLV